MGVRLRISSTRQGPPGDKGDKGPDGPDGERGVDGPSGIGVSAGGLDGQSFQSTGEPYVGQWVYLQGAPGTGPVYHVGGAAMGAGFASGTVKRNGTGPPVGPTYHITGTARGAGFASGIVTRTPGGGGPPSAANSADQIALYGGWSFAGSGGGTALTDAELVRWMTTRKARHWILGGMQPRTMSGSTTPYRSSDVYIKAQEPKYAGQSWGQRVRSLGGESVALVKIGARSNSGGGNWGNNSGKGKTPFPLWHDDAGWAAFMTDLDDYFTTMNEMGVTGLAFDGETLDNKSYFYFSLNYQGKPAAQTLQETKQFIYDRGKQIGAKMVQRLTGAASLGGPTLMQYYCSIANGLFDSQYAVPKNLPGGVGAISNENVHPYLFAGIMAAPGMRWGMNLDQIWYGNYGGGFRLAYLFPESDLSGMINGGFWDVTAMGIAMAKVLTECEPSGPTRKAVARKCYITPMCWPAAGLDTQRRLTATQWDQQVAGMTRVAPNRTFCVYLPGQPVNAQSSPGDSSSENQVWTSRYEATVVARMTNRFVVDTDTQPPSVQVTAPTSSAVHTTDSATATPVIAIGGTATDDFAIQWVEWTNAANGETGICSLARVVTDPQWNLLDSAKKPRNAALGLINGWRMDWGTFVPLKYTGSPTVNTITVTAYDGHGKSASDVIQVIRSK